ncbi:hypothetical protein LPB248_02285 [Flavobacterium sp. LPB0248]|uniref:hypothetical protein n=1 Tax=Flavobacterium sp. LPB0248 TaxID=2614441 RepID=UPI0015A670F0|nr:hypothetical protein [Flavobacterium sp. LPB0248]QLC65146.1 hypothetical protein LPB248_02285 [Flavobacterium sp. LPB0248]
MRNLFVFFTYFTLTTCFSQNTKIDSDQLFTTQQIDSICEKNNRSIISEGSTNVILETKTKKEKPVISNGRGGFSYQLYLNHFNEENYNALSNAEKRKYNIDKYSNLIKGLYHQSIHFENSYSENIYGEFYYFKTTLFYAKIKIERIEKNKENISEIFNLSIADLNDPRPIKNVFLKDIKKMIEEKNKKIIEIYNNK